MAAPSRHRDPAVPAYVLQLLETSRTAAGQQTPRDGLRTALDAVLRAALAADICDLAGVTERSKRLLTTVAVTEPGVQRLDRVQYEAGQGPGVQTAFEDGLLVSQNLSVDTRWPEWVPAAEAMGVASIISVQLHSDRLKLGALNLYSRRSRMFESAEVEMARFLAANASIAMASYRKAENLWVAIDARHRIGVAQGILIGRYGLTTAQSFEALRRISNENELKLGEVAAIINAHGGIPTAFRPDASAPTHTPPPSSTRHSSGGRGGQRVRAGSR